MKGGLMTELQKNYWAMESRRADAFGQQIFAYGVGDLTVILEAEANGVDPQAAVDRPSTSKMDVRGSDAIIPISGVLMKSVPSWFKWFGIEATAYSDIRDNLRSALGNNAVDRIIPHFDTPGGTVAGVQETADAIFAARAHKPVIAVVEDLCASAGYFLASQATEIHANINGETGSIGVFTVYYDLSEMAEKEGIKAKVIKFGEHKGMGVPGAPITKEQEAAVQDVIDKMGGNFVAAIARGRGDRIPDVMAVATGRTWLSAEAKELGLIDQVGTIESILAGGPPNHTSTHSQRSDLMGDENKKTEEDLNEIRKEAASKASGDSVGRFSELKAAFPDDLAFAAEQFEAGASVTDAKAAYADVLAERNKELQTKLDAHATAPAAGTKPGVPYVENENDDEPAAAGSEEDFMALADGLMAKNPNLSLEAAYGQIAAKHPKAYDAYLAGLDKMELRDGAAAPESDE